MRGSFRWSCFFLLLSIVPFGGCSSGPSKRDIAAQLNKYHLFVESETVFTIGQALQSDENIHIKAPAKVARFEIKLGIPLLNQDVAPADSCTVEGPAEPTER